MIKTDAVEEFSMLYFFVVVEHAVKYVINFVKNENQTFLVDQ